MNKETMYKAFRNELDKYAIPLILKNINYIDLKYENKIVGFMCLESNYLDAFYILPKYRHKGIGSKLAKEMYKKYRYKTLCIINNNTPAIEFWQKNFIIEKLDSNFCDSLYAIIGVV